MKCSRFALAALLAALAAHGYGAVGARYVTVDIPRESATLSLAEVEVFVGDKNVAPSGQATQSSTAYKAPAKRAIDGNTSDRFGANTITHTEENVDTPTWELDLGRAYPIDRVVLWNRGEGFGGRLDGVRVTLSDGERKIVWEEDRPKTERQNFFVTERRARRARPHRRPHQGHQPQRPARRPEGLFRQVPRELPERQGDRRRHRRLAAAHRAGRQGLSRHLRRLPRPPEGDPPQAPGGRLRRDHLPLPRERLQAGPLRQLAGQHRLGRQQRRLPARLQGQAPARPPRPGHGQGSCAHRPAPILRLHGRALPGLERQDHPDVLRRGGRKGRQLGPL